MFKITVNRASNTLSHYSVTIPAVGMALLLGACATLPLDSLAPPTMTPPSVSFIIPIDKGAFSLAEPLEVTLWNTEQLAISAKNRQCFVNEEIHVGNSSSNVKPSEEIRCPEGIVYENYTPQEFTFALQDINSPIIITNTTIQVGEEYALSIYGLANDNCNMTSGHGNGIAHSNIITPDDMIWMTTLLECLDTP